MKALIIGAAGFVGHHLIEHLNTLNWDVCATRLPNEKIGLSVRQYELDILDAKAVNGLLDLAKPELIFYLAAQSSVALSWKQPALTVDVNIKGALNLFEAVRLTGIKPRILLIGSGEEYGFVSPSDLPINESALPRPGNIYAATKAAQGMLGQIYARAYGMDIIIVRAFNHAGPGQPETFVVSSFCKQVAEMEAGMAKPVLYTGELSVKRDFSDVRDIVRAYALLIQNGVSGEIYNVGSSKAVSIKDILDIILANAKISVAAEVDPKRMRPSDTPIIEADIGKLAGTIDWAPGIPLERTIIDTLSYWRGKIPDAQRSVQH